MNQSPLAIERIVVPRQPEPATPFQFPVIATIAPVGAAVVMWAITRSPFALMFAALGPIVAIASLADARIQSRRRLRKEGLRFRRDLVLVTESVTAAHAHERAALDDATPAGRCLAARTGPDASRWKADSSAAVLVSLGRAVRRSELQLHGLPTAGTETGDDLDELRAVASRLGDAPVVVDARLGIGIFGHGAVATATARAVVLQLAWTLSPAEYWISAASTDSAWSWLTELPHPSGPAQHARGQAIAFGLIGSDAVVAIVALAGSRDDIAGTHRVVMAVDSSSAAIVDHPNRAMRMLVTTEAVSAEEAFGWAVSARLAAEADGIITGTRSLPASVTLASLMAGQSSTGRGLSCAFAVTDDGPLVVDLVADGPHAVIGGTTGSGKSELLTSWVLAMAAAWSPEVVNFLLCDFKGGSTFGPLERLQHTVGVITDLDEAEAQRALDSVRGELRHRERELAVCGAKDIAELAPGRLARLVVIVDEFAAMLADFPELHALFGDVAARGRALGVHLVLCTQRPAAVARDAVLANTDLRISLRVNNRADSIALVGTDDAAAISAIARGRAVVAMARDPGRVVQVALATPHDAELVSTRWPGEWHPRRPWCAPLSATIDRASLGGRVGAFGLLDLPAEQRQTAAIYDPVTNGHLIVLGAHRAGRTTALQSIAATIAGAQWVPSDAESAWDAISHANGSRPALLVLDDLDALLPRFSDEHRSAFIDRLARVMRDGPAREIRFAVSAQRLTGELQSIVSLVPSRLLLRQSNRQDHVLAGATAGTFDSTLPPGGGEWFGHRVQVAIGATLAVPRSTANAVVIDRGRPLAIVSSRPGQAVRRFAADWSVVALASIGRDSQGMLIAAGGTRTAIIGDVEQWQSSWGALGSLRSTNNVLFDGCTAADYRALTRSRELPPPITDPRAHGWLLEPDGTVSRVRLPDEV